MSNFDQIPIMLEVVGKKIVEWRNDLGAKKILSERDFKTEADLRTHSLISHQLSILFPGIVIISEEDTSHSKRRPDKYWLIDPIDGTASWYNGFDGFVTQVAYIENSVPVYGAIHAPILKKTWTATAGCGAYLNGKKLPKLEKNNRLIFIDNTKYPHGILKEIMQSLPSTGYIECGSLGLKSVFVADGTADLFIKDVCVRDWDLAPAMVILNEVGGLLTQLNGMPYFFYGDYVKKEGFIVARSQQVLDNTLKCLEKFSYKGMYEK